MDRQAGFWRRNEHPYEQQYESELRRYAADADTRGDLSARSRDEELRIEAMELRYRQEHQRERDSSWRGEQSYEAEDGPGSPEGGERRVRMLESLTPEPGLIISPESSPYAARDYSSSSRTFEREEAFWNRSRTPSDVEEDRSFNKRSHGRSRSGDRDRYRSRSRSGDRDRARDRSRSMSGDRDRYRSRSGSRDRSRYRSGSPSQDRRSKETKHTYSRSPERRRHRHRSREHERDYKESGYSNSRTRDYRNQRGHKEQTPQPCKEPSPLILLRNLPASATRGDIEVSTRGFQTREILFFKERESGKGRGICLVEFAYQADASSWLSQNSDSFFIQGEKISLDYTPVRGRDGDWTCSKCKASNFRHRLVCFICSNPQHECEESQQGSRPFELAPPSNVLILRGLKVSSGEEAVRMALASISNHPVRDVRLIKDRITKESRGFCFIEFTGVNEATETLDTIFEQAPAFFIDGTRTIANFARGNFLTSGKGLSHAGQSAIEQGGWSSSGENRQEGPEAVRADPEYSSNPVGYSSDASDPTASTSQYQFDASSGYYYDTSSGLYYDPKSQYHYDPVSQKFCYYDTAQSKYVYLDTQTQNQNPQSKTETEAEKTSPAPEDTETADSSKSKEKKKPEIPDNFSTGNQRQARKIAKDMERWAQKQNTSKSYKPATAPVPQENEPNPQSTDLSGDFTLGPITLDLEHRSAPRPGVGITNSSGQLDFSQLGPTQALSTPSISLPLGSFNAEPLYTDWDRLACLLCKRQFQSKDQLIKHQQLSDLHKQNLEKTRY